MSLVEFEAALSVYVREDEEDGSLTDTRDERVAELALPKVSAEVLTLMEPSDLAAMLSGSVGVRDAAKAKAFTAKKLMRNLASLRANDALPLVAKPGHPANAVLDKLLSGDEDGVRAYASVMALLTQAKREGVAHIYEPNKRVKRTDDLITAPVDPTAYAAEDDEQTQTASSEE